MEGLLHVDVGEEIRLGVDTLWQCQRDVFCLAARAHEQNYSTSCCQLDGEVEQCSCLPTAGMTRWHAQRTKEMLYSEMFQSTIMSGF